MEFLLVTMAINFLAQDGIAVPDPGPTGLCCAQDSWVAGELLVTFYPGTTLDTVEAIAAEVGATVLDLVGEYSWGVLYKMGVPPGEELDFIPMFEAYAEVDHAGPNHVYCVPELPPCTCCPPGLTCMTLPVCIYLGEVSIRVRKSANVLGRINIEWTRVCGVGGADFGIYEGAIGSYDLHTAIVCTDEAPYLVEEVTPAPGDRYYLVVPHNAWEEATYGKDSSGNQRPQGLDTCVWDQLIEPECP